MTNKALALGAGMFALSLFAAVTSGRLVLWFSAAFFGLGLATFVLSRLRPPTLAIHSESMEMIGSLGGRQSYRYSDCGPFSVFKQTVARGQRVDWLTFDYEGKQPRTWLQRANSKMAGANSQLRVDGFEQSPHEIAALLNNYRDAARSLPDAP